jgi:hypothetical protein
MHRNPTHASPGPPCSLAILSTTNDFTDDFTNKKAEVAVASYDYTDTLRASRLTLGTILRTTLPTK